MRKGDMLRSLFGWGIVLFFLWFLGLSVMGDTWLYLETGVRIAVSLFMTGLGLSFRYQSMRIRELERQVEELKKRRSQVKN